MSAVSLAPSAANRTGACASDSDCPGAACVGVATTRDGVDSAKQCLPRVSACKGVNAGLCPSFPLAWGVVYRQISPVCAYVPVPADQCTTDLACLSITTANGGTPLDLVYGCVDFDGTRLLLEPNSNGDNIARAFNFSEIVKANCVNPLNAHTLCSGQGTCAPDATKSMDYACTCNPGFGGKLCEKILNNQCLSDSACGGGVCKLDFSQCAECPTGTLGNNCAQCDPSYSDATKICSGHGKCISSNSPWTFVGLTDTDAPHQCQCDEGYMDVHCAVSIQTRPTSNGTNSSAPANPPVSPTDNTTASSSNVGRTVGIVSGVVVGVALVAFAAFKLYQRRRRAAAKPAGESPGHPYNTPSTKPRRMAAGSMTAGLTNSEHWSFSSATWEDPVLLTMRVPYESVAFGALLSRGGYGEVYQGTYRGETVAIKQLLPERRKQLSQIEAFLSEVKLLAVLEHERIVRFIGVAWNALSDVCVLVEYMDLGDLRSVLAAWHREQRPQGFDHDKVKIAVHIAHALTYLHSLQPVVVHRDLKSKNILLSTTLDAKLTDFGVSREREDATMTAGVGSSLWMAPEVMLGDRYDEKADVFSFGVVLSELDTQTLPYTHAKETGTNRKIPDSAVLQLVALGREQVQFTDLADLEVVALGRACVQLSATNRPTAAEVLYRLHRVLRRLCGLHEESVECNCVRRQ